MSVSRGTPQTSKWGPSRCWWWVAWWVDRCVEPPLISKCSRASFSLISHISPSLLFFPLLFQHFTDPRHSGTWRVAHKQMPLVCCVTLLLLLLSLCFRNASASHMYTHRRSHIIVNDVWRSPLWVDLLLGFIFICSDWDMVAGGRGWDGGVGGVCCLEVRF